MAKRATSHVFGQTQTQSENRELQSDTVGRVERPQTALHRQWAGDYHTADTFIYRSIHRSGPVCQYTELDAPPVTGKGGGGSRTPSLSDTRDSSQLNGASEVRLMRSHTLSCANHNCGY